MLTRCIRMMQMTVVVGAHLIAMASVLADGPFVPSSPVPEALAPGFESISEPGCELTLKALVEGEMSGRGTGQAGYIQAAKWFAGELESCGFQPGGENGSWFQNVPFFKLATAPDQCSFAVGENVLIPGGDLGISSWSGRFEGQLPVAFVTLKNDRPEIKEGSLSGCLVLVQSGGRISPDDEFLLKAAPACILIVSDDSRVRNEAVNPSDPGSSSIPAALVTRTAANALAARCGLNADFFVEGSPTRGRANVEENRVISTITNVTCRLQVDRESVDVPNVVGWLPGSDESVRNEHICLGAHLDHLGIQRGDLYPGADDNGSGSAAILEVARALGANPVKPRRSVLIIAFCAEERGLLGSKYYAGNPTHPLKDMICMLNIDMIGRNEETAEESASTNENTIHLVGSKDHSTGMHQLIEKANEQVGFIFEYDEEDRVDGRSDHASFSEKNIPVAFLFGGFNPHYHKTTDTLAGINFAKIANAARLYYMAIHLAAEHGPFTLDVQR